MLQSAQNKVIVKVATKYISNITSIMKMASIQQGATVHLEDIVQIVGEIVSLPRAISNDRSHEGYSTKDLLVGDTCIFSFNIISDYYQREHNGEPVYKNLITYKAEEYWVVDISRLFGVIRKNEIIMVNGFVMAVPPEGDKIILQVSDRKSKGTKSSEVISIGNPKTNKKKINVIASDTVFYNPNIAAHYQIKGKPFVIIQQHQIVGKVSGKCKK